MKTIDLIRGGRTERFYSPYDNEHVIDVLEGMLKDRRVCSPFAAEIARTCRAGKADEQKWAWVHRIVIDHENKKAPPPRPQPIHVEAKATTPPLPDWPGRPMDNGQTHVVQERRAAAMTEGDVRAYVRDLLRHLQVAEIRRLADDCFLKTTDPVQTANWKAVGRELERLYPTTQTRKYLIGPEDLAWAMGLIDAFGNAGALEAVLDVQRDVGVECLAKWGRVETAIRKLNAEKAEEVGKKASRKKVETDRPSRGSLKTYKQRKAR